MTSERKRDISVENGSKQSQPHPKQPKWDFRSMAYFEQYPTEPQMEEKIQRQPSAAANHQTGMGDDSTSTNTDDEQAQQPLYKEITNHIHKMDRFAVQRHVTEFLLNAQHEQPDEALRQAFKELIVRAVQNAEEQNGRVVSKLGITVTGKGLNDPVVLPIRPQIQNNADVLMAELDKLGQSEGDEGGADKKTLLLSEPVEIVVTCLTPPDGSAPRFYPYQSWPYNETQRIRIRNNDNYCLFHALVAGRAYHDKEIFLLNAKSANASEEYPFMEAIKSRSDFSKNLEAFNRFLTNADRMKSAVKEIMNAAEISDDLSAYGIEHIQLVQQYWVYHEKKSGCFIKCVTVPKEKQRYRIVVWDTETRLHQLEDEGQRIHVANFLSARVTCTECCDSSEENYTCDICCSNNGVLERMKDWSEADGDEPVADFIEWILRAWARRPDVVMNGLKIYEFRVQHSRQHSMLIWRDSCLIMPVALAELKKTFNLDCEDKPFFPYAFNTREHYSVRLQHLPDEKEYDSGSMKADKCEKFQKWYNENKETPFYLPDELRTYCQNDTEILLKALLKFRHLLMHDITKGFDVLPISCTIASACMNIFKAQFMEEKQLAIVPELGYERNDRASVHAGNGREKRWKNFKLDGWIESQQRCIEVLGCYWHGCNRCFNPDEQLVDGKTCSELYETTQDRLRQLREPDSDGNCLEVEEVWECDINAMLKKNDEMRTFFGDLANERGPLDPRLAYCGGRTGPLRLFAEPAEDEKISVFDIVSLYPWVNYDTNYPIGVPTIVRPSSEEMIVNWTKPKDLEYRGIYRVRVIPPRGLQIPVLPTKIDERLLFSCCHRCAASFRKSVTRCTHKCNHSEKERAYTGNYTHIELEKALEMGYVIDRFWRAWHYEEWSDQIFKGYVESSGFPDGTETPEQKQQYIGEYRRIYSVELDLGRIKKNPGLRFIAKLMLNSLWGKFSMRNQLGSNKVITRPQEFYDLVNNYRMEISTIIPISDDAIRVMYKPKKNFIAEHTSSNIVLSLWTTSRARLKLLDYMLQCHNTLGAELLYTDTDSVMVLHKSDRIPVQTGEYLGQMSEEYTDYDIKTYACGGAKQYALKMVHKQTKAVKYVQKIRGITFDVNNSQELQFKLQLGNNFDGHCHHFVQYMGGWETLDGHDA
ncbi:hypothetical protein niasHT_020888 [Heterodera trifolii]|uniref:DNA-directed DNA polymerase n=1 Tax=Heterodera trifolii TaxID=157864 RepID=A0ABD2KBM2_9BILA